LPIKKLSTISKRRLQKDLEPRFEIRCQSVGLGRQTRVIGNLQGRKGRVVAHIRDDGSGDIKGFLEACEEVAGGGGGVLDVGRYNRRPANGFSLIPGKGTMTETWERRLAA